MKVVQCAGTPGQIGAASGEALREEIRQHIEVFPMRQWEEWKGRKPLFIEALKRYLPHVLEEMEATARGADVAVDEILRLNIPLYPHGLTTDEACSNVVFTGGGDGPVWGKNNDGREPHRPICARYVKPVEGVPQVTFAFCGMVATTDGMNAEGLAVGHSSVGSTFQQSDHFVPIRLLAYDAMMKSRTTADFVRHLSETPIRGKGYSMVCVDRQGVACSIEAPCPLVQVRRPASANGVHCVNCYQLPALSEADRRTPTGKCDAHGRMRLLDGILDGEGPFDLAHMERTLCCHEEPGLCRHGECEHMVTEYAMIGLPAHNRLLFTDGNPCRGGFEELLL